MMKKFIAFLITVALLSLNINVFTASADTCTQHSNYQDYVSNVSHWQSGSEEVVVGQDPNTGALIKAMCYITTEAVTHTIVCGVCGTPVGGYVTYNYYHSISH